MIAGRAHIALLAALVLCVPVVSRGATPAGLPGSAGASDPSIAVDSSGVATVAATTATGDATALWRLDAGGGAAALKPAGIVGVVPGGAAGAIAVDSAGYPHLAELGRAGVVVRRSIDGGDTWDRGSAFAAPPARAAALAVAKFNSIVEGATLVLAVDVAGVIVVARSNDGGLTFAQATVADSGCARDACTLGDVAVNLSASDVWVAFARAGGAHVAHSSDGGQTFADTAISGAPIVEPPSLARAHDGTLYLASATANQAIVARSIDNGSSFGVIATFDGEARGVRMAAGSLGSLAAAWYARAGDGWNLVVARSESGAAFETPIVLDAVGNSAPVSKVALAADPAGGFVAAYERPVPGDIAGVRT